MPDSHRISLTSVGIAHPRVRQFLNIKHNRGRHGRAMALEGLWSLNAALGASVPVEVVFVCAALLRGPDAWPVLDELRQQGAHVFAVSERVFQRLTERDGPDGLAAIAHLPDPGLEDIATGDGARVVIADSFELAGNLGTLIRCADGAGAGGVILTERRVRLTNPLVLKASMGTLFTMPVVAAEREEVLTWLRRARLRLIAADPASSVSYRDTAYGRAAIVLGSERYGLAPFWRDAADVTVSIPMLGVADSLNVGHAAALLLYEAAHQARDATAGATHPGRAAPGRRQ